MATSCVLISEWVQLRKVSSTDVGGSNGFTSILESVNNNCTINHFDFSKSDSFESKPNISNNQSYEPEQMENNNRMLKVLSTLDYPQLAPTQSYELKYGLIHLLPKFHGLADEDLHKHLKEFHVATGDIGGLHRNECISFFLRQSYKRLAILTVDYVQHLGDMKRMFLEKFFPASRTATIRKEICGTRQYYRETLHEYWERFNKLCATCPHH
ncbi:hypothetical protein CR513_31666, partial [Mucuna pruriens]